MPGCPCRGCVMGGQRLLFLTALALELLGGAGGSQLVPRSRGAAAACRLDNEESESWGALLSGERLDTWVCSLLGSLVVGLSGVFPLLVVPLEMGATLRSEAGARRLKQLLSFALGGLLGNVFLHLLPEAWAYTCSSSTGAEGQNLQQQQKLGLWVIAGFLTFLALEKMFLDSKEKEGSSQAPSKGPAAAALNGGRSLALPAAEPGLSAVVRNIQVSGYLNLLANTIDNFTHGLAVAASFLVSKKIGLLTTMAILLHEIPHEVGDFAILLRAGFDRWSAAKLQLSTALGGLLGACFAICMQTPKGVAASGLLPLQRRPWPGSCPSRPAASSTSPWSLCSLTSWRKTTCGTLCSKCSCSARASWSWCCSRSSRINRTPALHNRLRLPREHV